MSFPRAGKSASPRSPPSWATCAPASKARITSPPKPASLRSHIRAVDPAASAGDGLAINGCAPPSPASPTTPDMPAHGPPMSTVKLASGAASTLTPCASSHALGCASSGELAGRQAIRSPKTSRRSRASHHWLTQEVSCASSQCSGGSANDQRAGARAGIDVADRAVAEKRSAAADRLHRLGGGRRLIGIAMISTADCPRRGQRLTG